MKKYLFVCFGMAGFISTTLHAQNSADASKPAVTKEETVVIKRGTDARTVIEIKNGSVYVNGDAVVTIHDADAGKVHKKIIIENTPGSSGSSDFSITPFGGMNDEETGSAPRKAMLGVVTDAKDTQPGALVKEVTPGSPAEKAGLLPGDRITRLDGKQIADAKALSMEVGTQHNAGDKVSVEYMRGGKASTTSATLIAAAPQAESHSFHFNNPQDAQGSMPNSFFKEFRFPGMESMDDARPKIGVSVEDRADGSGATVLSVTSSSAAAKAGIREGDVITKVADDKISTAADLQEKLAQGRPGERVSIQYQRSGKDLSADLILPRAVSRRDL